MARTAYLGLNLVNVYFGLVVALRDLVCDFSALVGCYMELDGRFRPTADIEPLQISGTSGKIPATETNTHELSRHLYWFRSRLIKTPLRFHCALGKHKVGAGVPPPE